MIIHIKDTITAHVVLNTLHCIIYRSIFWETTGGPFIAKPSLRLPCLFFYQVFFLAHFPH